MLKHKCNKDIFMQMTN